MEGHAVGTTPRASFLLDFATYARFFLAVPLIFAAEALVGPRVRSEGLRFVQSGIVQSSDHPALHQAALRAERRRDAALPEVLFLGIALIGAWFLTIEQVGGVGTATWYTMSTGGTVHLTFAGLWYHFIAIPLVQFFLLRSLWRLAIWTLFLREVSQLRLNLIPLTRTRRAGWVFWAPHMSRYRSFLSH